jgi:aryl-alcohol dehydrogenase-like predicted oxidoreductase
MRNRPLGRTGLEVPPVMLGGNVFGWTVGEDASFRILDAAFDAGLNLIDTADTYSRWVPGNSGGESETIIGKWLARTGRRDRVIVATKVGMDMGDGRKGLSPQHIERSAEQSLRRLGTDRIDLYQAHEDDPNTPLEETLRAFERLLEQGKVRFIGASNYTGARLRAALETSERFRLPRYETLQPLYNLLDREPYESDLAPVALEYGLGVIPYFALAAGFLTGKYRDQSDLQGRARGGIVAKYLHPRGLSVLDELRAAAARHNTTPAVVALAWLLTRPAVTAPIASATTTQHVAELVEAANLELDPDSIARLTAASEPVPA